NEPVNVTKLLENGTMPTSDLLNAIQSLSRRCLLEQQGIFYELPPVLREYVIANNYTRNTNYSN
ncbi:MAG: hypothetical protein WA828_04795, partial [Coleofasciculaceae cyanobacterium]